MASDVLLTLNEVADLEGKEYESIRKSVQRENLKAVKVNTNERKGFEYRVRLNDLSDAAKARYYAKLKATDLGLDFLEEKEEEKYTENIEELTASQRKEIAYWNKTLKDWRSYIAQYPGQMTEKTKEFIEIHNIQNPKMAIKERTLRDKWTKLRKYGEVALADHRQNRKDKGRSSIDDTLWSVFLQWWLDENKPTTSHVHRVLKYFVDMKMPELAPIPSRSAFDRKIKTIPLSALKYYREGEKVFSDECLPYLVRMYHLINSNDIWTSDYHTLDMMVRDDLTGKVFRPHVVVWSDIRSRKVLSMRLCETSNSDGVILAFRDAVEKFGIPKEVYLDNGREYLVHDFGGRGKRKVDENSDYGSSILERLGITMTNAIVRNAKAKVVERSFKQVSEEFSRMYITYCGNRPENRPERHNKVLKNTENIPLLSEIKEDLKTYIEGEYNMRESKAEGLNGKSPNECYAENLITKRTATEEQLNLMLTRSSRLRTVQRNGVYLKFGDRKVYFYDTDLVTKYMGQKVYVRYDSDDLSSVRVTDSEERLIGTAHILEVGGYSKDMDKEAIKKVNSKSRKIKNFVKDYMDEEVERFKAPEMKDVLLEQARKNIEEDKTSYEATVIQPLQFMNKENVSKAVGDNEGIIDMNRMIQNAMKNKGE